MSSARSESDVSSIGMPATPRSRTNTVTTAPRPWGYGGGKPKVAPKTPTATPRSVSTAPFFFNPEMMKKLTGPKTNFYWSEDILFVTLCNI